MTPDAKTEVTSRDRDANRVLIISTQRHSISVGLLTLSFRYFIREDEFYVLLNFGGQIR